MEMMYLKLHRRNFVEYEMTFKNNLREGEDNRQEIRCAGNKELEPKSTKMKQVMVRSLCDASNACRLAASLAGKPSRFSCTISAWPSSFNFMSKPASA